MGRVRIEVPGGLQLPTSDVTGVMISTDSVSGRETNSVHYGYLFSRLVFEIRLSSFLVGRRERDDVLQGWDRGRG